jgi:NADH:ubiquinone oxidoreductase subunit 5 (subunit L)/multisubunit Na+/H+ antiporter MnhA subunit
MSDLRSNSKFSRRQFLRGSAAVGATLSAFALAGCPAPAPAQPAAQSGGQAAAAAPAAEAAKVLFWKPPHSEKEADLWKPLLKKFTDANPNITVDHQVIPWGSVDEQFTAAFAGDAKGEAHGDTTAEIGLMALSLGIALVGMGVGWTIFKKHPLRKMPKLLENKWYVDEGYDAAIINPITNVSRTGLWQWFDLGLIDGIVNGVGKFLAWIGCTVRYMQGGYVRNYAAFILLGALFVVGYFICQFIPLLAK